MMFRISKWLVSEWPTLCVIVIGIATQLFLVIQPINTLISTILPDDAFYYFGVVRNIVAGLGSTFDGISATNGYHPLWTLVLIPLFKFFASPFPDIQPIYIALYVQVALNLITAFLVARIISRFTRSQWVRALGMVVWMLNPFLLYETVNGLETSLALFFFSIFFLFALRIEEGRPLTGGYISMGLIGGLMTLARLDMAVYVLALLVWIIARNGWQVGWGKAFSVGIWSAVPVVPYFLWNIWHFHMLLTSASGAAVLENHMLIIQDHGPGWGQFFKAVVYSTQYELDHFFKRTGLFTLGAMFIGAFVVLTLQGVVRIPRKMRDSTLTWTLFCGFVLIFIADASIRWTARTWYFVSFDLFMAIVIVIVADRLFRMIEYKRIAAILIMSLVLFSFYVDWSKNLRGVNNPLYGETALRDAAEWMNDYLPRGAIRGGFAAGIQGYFSDAPFVDLDGLVSNDVYTALRKRQLWDYIRHHVVYISTDNGHFTYQYKSFLGIDDPFARLRLITEIPGSELKIYQVE